MKLVAERRSLGKDSFAIRIRLHAVDVRHRVCGMRSSIGASIAEFPITMMITFLVLVFPTIDLLTLAIVYSAGSTLNDLQLRQAAMLPHAKATTDAGPVQRKIPNNWRSSGLGRFAKVDGAIETDVTYRDGETDENGLTEKLVRVNTSFAVEPFLIIPFPMSVPGLNAPVTFTYSSERALEDPTDAPPSNVPSP